jgi:hypothetical protein
MPKREDLHFTIQEGCASDWLRVVDTSLRVPADFAEPGREIRLQTLDYPVKARSIVTLIRPGKEKPFRRSS